MKRQWETPQRPGDDTQARLVDRAQNGCGEALGQLLDGCRQYLLLVANQEIDRPLRGKVGASDLVQDTFMDAQRDFQKFHGGTEADLLHWLRQILINNLHDARRRYGGTAKRRISREVPLYRPNNRASMAATRRAADVHSPSWFAMRREEAEAMRGALDRLADDHRRVIVLRNLELRPFPEIAKLMDRSEAAARKLWARAIEALAQQMGAEHHGGPADE